MLKALAHLDLPYRAIFSRRGLIRSKAGRGTLERPIGRAAGLKPPMQLVQLVGKLLGRLR
jgi:hypothetical protein